MSDASKRCYECDHCGMDMDMDPYCVEPNVVGAGNIFGLVTRRARDTDGKCGPEAKFFTPRTPRVLPQVDAEQPLDPAETFKERVAKGLHAEAYNILEGGIDYGDCEEIVDFVMKLIEKGK